MSVEGIPLKNKRWTDEQFAKYLAKVKSWWPTGQEVDLDEAVAYRQTMPDHRNLYKVWSKAEAEGRTLVLDRAGFATVEETLKTHSFAKKHGADLVRISTDTYTRRMDFDKAKAALEESIRVGRSMLNGFPSVVHGVAANRRLYEGIDLPITTSISATHTELHTLITLAAGAGEALGDAFQGIPYSKPNIDPGDIIIFRQFVDRLVGWFEEKGGHIMRANKFVGVLTPQSIKIASTVMGALLAAEQGVKNFGVQANTNLAMIQDIAAQRVLRKLTRSYLDKFGYKGNILLTLSLFNGYHPPDQSECFALILLGTAIARWGGASRIDGRTIDEGVGLPTKESQGKTVRAMKRLLILLQRQKMPESDELTLECYMLEKEARAIIDKALELGDGDIAIGAVKALDLGTLDYTYPANKRIHGKAISVRDCSGSVRFLDTGNLPFDHETKEFHRQRVAERMRVECKKDYQLIIEDLSGKVANVPGLGG
ncbi:MAG: hypothetical protein HYX90_03645 [Chloroflexi bacterium]|nr:hypothetical protein [Chloroflexota bacterium]